MSSGRNTEGISHSSKRPLLGVVKRQNWWESRNSSESLLFFFLRGKKYSRINGVKQERLLEVRKTEFTVPIEVTMSKILYFPLTHIYGTCWDWPFEHVLWFDKYRGDLNCISCSSSQVEGLFRSSQENELKLFVFRSVSIIFQFIHIFTVEMYTRGQ